MLALQKDDDDGSWDKVLCAFYPYTHIQSAAILYFLIVFIKTTATGRIAVAAGIIIMHAWPPAPETM